MSINYESQYPQGPSGPQGAPMRPPLRHNYQNPQSFNIGAIMRAMQMFDALQQRQGNAHELQMQGQGNAHDERMLQQKLLPQGSRHLGIGGAEITESNPRGNPGGDPFTNGFFQTAPQRQQSMAEHTGAYEYKSPELMANTQNIMQHDHNMHNPAPEQYARLPFDQAFLSPLPHQPAFGDPERPAYEQSADAQHQVMMDAIRKQRMGPPNSRMSAPPRGF